MQLHLNHPPPGVAHNRTGRECDSSCGGSAYPVVPSSCLGPVAHITSLSRPPLISKESSRSAGGLFLPLFFHPSYVALAVVARRRGSWHDSPLAASAGSFLRGRVASLDLRPRARLMGRERRSGSTTHRRSEQAAGDGMLSVGARTCGKTEELMLYSPTTSSCLCACLPACLF